MEQTALFRKAALDRLSSPEQLDTLMRVTDAKGWLALVGAGVIIATALVWSVTGKVQSKVSATGIIMATGGLVEVTAPGEGDLTELYVNPGDAVTKTQVIAQIAQPALAEKIDALRKRIEEIPAGTDNARRERLSGDLDHLKQQFEENSHIVAGVDGHVVEVRAVAGDHLTTGRPLVAVERTNPTKSGSLEALLYFDSERGKALRPGTPVELVPSVVSQERYGVLLGKVASVEMYPSTRLGMMSALHNEQLVEGFIQSAGGAPIAVRVEFQTDPSTKSGYRWSSGAGPDITLTSGTRCTASVITRTHRPIGLVFPVLDIGN